MELGNRFRGVLVIEQANGFHLLISGFPLHVASSSNWNCIRCQVSGRTSLDLAFIK